jgi:hypothetical protein
LFSIKKSNGTKAIKSEREGIKLFQANEKSIPEKRVNII